MTFGDRLRGYRESLGTTQREMAETLGLPTRTYQDYERGLSTPKIETLQKLAETGCDIAWLITGSRSAAGRADEQPPSSTVVLPRYNAVLSAGQGFAEPEQEAEHPLFVTEDFLRRVLGRAPRGLVVATASGHSMAPTINDGELLIIDSGETALQNGRIYAVSVNGELFVKRISRTLRGQIMMLSDNPSPLYAPEELMDGMSLRVIGQVIWHGGALG